MKFLKLLKRLKGLSNHHTHQMSCVIANKNQVVSIGYNQCKTHPRSGHKYKMVHAELAAVLDNKFADLKGCTAYIYRETRDGNPAMAKPCNSCLETLKHVGIKKIVYSQNGNFKEENLC
jgi:deoxycytidylate deaminase